MPLPLPHLRLGQREGGSLRKQQAFKDVSLVVMGLWMEACSQEYQEFPYYQPLLIAHSVTAEPEAWGGEGTGEVYQLESKS